MQPHIPFKYPPPGPAAGLADRDMPTIYFWNATVQEIPEVGEIVGLPTEKLDLPTSNTKEQQGESEMRFKVVSRDEGTHVEAAGGGDPPQEVTIIVTNFDG